MSEAREILLETIKTQGELVRKIKAAKEPKNIVSLNQCALNLPKNVVMNEISNFNYSTQSV